MKKLYNYNSIYYTFLSLKLDKYAVEPYIKYRGFNVFSDTVTGAKAISLNKKVYTGICQYLHVLDGVKHIKYLCFYRIKINLISLKISYLQ